MSRDRSVQDSSISETSPAQYAGRQLRVCMLAYAFYETDTRIMQYATALAERGDIVDVIALRRDDSLPKYEAINGVHVYRIQSRALNEKGLFAYVSRILRFLLRSTVFLKAKNRLHRYDAVHIHNVPDFLVFAAIFPKWNRVTVVLDIHDLLPEFYASKFKISHSSLLFKLMLLIERCSAKFADHVIVANDIWRDRLVARSSRAEKCSVVRNRPDLSIFVRQSEPRPRDGKFLLTYPGSLNWHQGLDIAIRAFARVAPEMPDAEFHIYGEGSAKSSLQILADGLCLQGRVIFHHFLPSQEVAKVMAKTDLAIEPKRTGSAFSNEALSTKILEFMALGVPIIACRTRIHAYYYDDSIIQYYENDDEVELAKQILFLRNNSIRCNSLIENAKRYADENTWDVKKGEYLELIDSLTNNKTSLLPSPSTRASAPNEITQKVNAFEPSRENSTLLRGNEEAPRYALISSAYNEELLIEKTMQSVISQTVRPVCWVIISDGSVDRTDEIIKNYSGQYSFIRYFRLEQNEVRGIVSKVNALAFAHKSLQNIQYDYIGNLDADVTFQPDYFESLLRKFELNPSLGIGGGLIYERQGTDFKCRISNSITSVAHAAQLVRRDCYESINGYAALKYGGEDWCAEISARMRGWTVRSFEDLKVMHHRPTGGANGLVNHRFREGKMDYSLGSDPVFELLKCLRRIPENPFCFGAVLRFLGFLWCYVRGEKRLVSPDIARFLRTEQKGRIRELFGPG
jgi:glycosyltransferase involved in cell wall biosynthesis